MFNDIGCGDDACGCMNTNTSIADVVNNAPVCKKHNVPEVYYSEGETMCLFCEEEFCAD